MPFLDTFRWKGENVATTEVGEVISMFPGIAEANVYGVEVNGLEGRCGMAAITLENPSENPNNILEGLFQHLEKHLPSYARPYFIMVQPEIEITSTFKHKKVELAKNGFDQKKTTNKIWLRSEKEKRFVPMNDSLYEAIQNGFIKL